MRWILAAAAATMWACGDDNPVSASMDSSASDTSPTVDQGEPTPDSDVPAEDGRSCGDGLPVPGEYCFDVVSTGLRSENPDRLAMFSRNDDEDAAPRVGVVNAGVVRFLEAERVDDEPWESRVLAELELGGGLSENLNASRKFSVFDWNGDGKTDIVGPGGSGFPEFDAYLQQPSEADLEFERMEPVSLGDWLQGGPFPLTSRGNAGKPEVLAAFTDGVQQHILEQHGDFIPHGPRIPLTNVCNDAWTHAEVDVDEDGDLDVLVFGSNSLCDAYIPNLEDPARRILSILIREGSSFHPEPVQILTGPPVSGLLGFADVDGDGRNDIIAEVDGSNWPPPLSLTWMRGRKGGSFNDGIAIPYPAETVLIGVQDFDGDGDIDGLFQTSEQLFFSDSILEPELVDFVAPDTPLRRALRGTRDLNGDGIADFAGYSWRPDASGDLVYQTELFISNP